MDFDLSYLARDRLPSVREEFFLLRKGRRTSLTSDTSMIVSTIEMLFEPRNIAPTTMCAGCLEKILWGRNIEWTSKSPGIIRAGAVSTETLYLWPSAVSWELVVIIATPSLLRYSMI